MSNEADDKEMKRRNFVYAGWAYSHVISDEGVCEGRSCFRCRLADILFEADAREKVEGLQTANQPEVKGTAA